MPDEKTIQKYIKVRQLAENGVDGEKANAAQILRRMEEENPGIRQAADVYARSTNSAGSTTQPDGGIPRKWQDIFKYAEAFYETASEFVENVTDMQQGTTLAEEVDVGSHFTRAENLLITLKMTVPTYRKAMRFNAMQRKAFREELHALLDEELDDLFGD